MLRAASLASSSPPPRWRGRKRLPPPYDMLMSSDSQAPAPARFASPPPDAPAPGTSVEIRPGLRWIRMPLPFALDHINLWAIEDGDGWAIVDTGILHPAGVSVWERILSEDLGGRDITRLIVTHMHPDHAGLAGWFTDRFGCDLWMTRTEYLTARSAAARTGAEPTRGTYDFYRRAGWQAAEIDANILRRTNMARLFAPFPDAFRRLRDGQTIMIGGRTWHVIAGGGHTPEHACLHCPDLDLLISGDKVLPGISSNISVDAAEPDANPVEEWFDTLGKLRARVPDSVLVLPSHKACFRGLHARIDELVVDQEDGLARLAQALSEPKRVVDLFGVLFNRPIDRGDSSLLSLATGETVAHLNYLLAKGQIERHGDDDGADRYRRVSSSAAQRISL